MRFSFGFTFWSALAGTALGCAAPSEKPATHPATPIASAPATGSTPSARAPQTQYQPPAHYRALFELGREWKYRGTYKSEFVDKDDPRANKNGNVTELSSTDFMCKVMEVHAFESSIASWVSCVGDDNISGTYGATPDGLYALTKMPESEQELFAVRAPEMTIAAAPKPEKRETKSDDGRHEHQMSVERTPQGEWCRIETWTAGDEGGRSICFADGIGITSYRSSWAGGSSKEVDISLEK